MFAIAVGVILTTKKLKIQFDIVAQAAPFERILSVVTSAGYNHGLRFISI
jgi:hypothetical protein